jgi:hypothetical protein
MAKQADVRADADRILVVWCSCERCAALEPRSTTLVRHHGREETVFLNTGCWFALSALDRTRD